MKITITPKDPKLAKNPAVKKWLRHAEKAVAKVLEEQHATDKIQELKSITYPQKKPRCLVCKRPYDERNENRGFHENPKTHVIELCKFKDGKIRMGQMMSDIYLPPIENGRADMKKYEALGKRLRSFKPLKRSKLSYRGDHYEN